MAQKIKCIATKRSNCNKTEHINLKSPSSTLQIPPFLYFCQLFESKTKGQSSNSQSSMNKNNKKKRQKYVIFILKYLPFIRRSATKKNKKDKYKNICSICFWLIIVCRKCNHKKYALASQPICISNDSTHQQNNTHFCPTACIDREWNRALQTECYKKYKMGNNMINSWIIHLN